MVRLANLWTSCWKMQALALLRTEWKEKIAQTLVPISVQEES